MQTCVLSNSPTDLAAILKEAKRTVIKLQEDIYSVRLEKRALVEKPKKRTSELSAFKAEMMSDAVLVRPA